MFSSLFSLQDVAPILSFSIIDFVWENLHYVPVRSLTGIIFQPDLEGEEIFKIQLNKSVLCQKKSPVVGAFAKYKI